MLLRSVRVEHFQTDSHIAPHHIGHEISPNLAYLYRSSARAFYPNQPYGMNIIPIPPRRYIPHCIASVVLSLALISCQGIPI